MELHDLISLKLDQDLCRLGKHTIEEAGPLLLHLPPNLTATPTGKACAGFCGHSTTLTQLTCRSDVICTDLKVTSSFQTGCCFPSAVLLRLS